MTPENKIKLKQELMEANMEQNEVAKHINMSKQTVNDLIWGRNKNKKLITQVVNLLGFDFTKYHNWDTLHRTS